MDGCVRTNVGGCGWTNVGGPMWVDQCGWTNVGGPMWVDQCGPMWVDQCGWTNVGGPMWVDQCGWTNVGGPKWVGQCGWTNVGGPGENAPSLRLVKLPTPLLENPMQLHVVHSTHIARKHVLVMNQHRVTITSCDDYYIYKLYRPAA